MTDMSPSNAPELSVTELANALKRTVEDRFGYVRVRGEVSGYRGPHSSGHVYFSLKDQGARLDAIIWKMAFAKMKIRPEEGLEVIASGKLTTFPGKSSYQIVIESLEPAGVGALMALLEERRKRLGAEGLFDQGRKRPIPFLPAVIGVVTSPTGAVIRDILHRLEDRFPRPVLVWPVRVQGETSGSEVAAAILGFNALPLEGPIPRPSVIIVARGGGSLEDLWGFNDEAVVRAVFESTIPVISAVGHETDWTLIDHVADLRAPTPTGAAEMCVPVRSDLLATLADLARRQHAGTRRILDQRSSALRSLARALPSGDAVVAGPRQRLDRASERLDARLTASLQDRRLRLSRASTLLQRHSPQSELARRRERYEGTVRRLRAARQTTGQRKFDNLAAFVRRLTTAMEARTGLARQQIASSQARVSLFHQRLRSAEATNCQRSQVRLQSASKLLLALGYKNVLQRGYALVLDEGGHPVRSASALHPGSRVDLQFAEGTSAALILSAEKTAATVTDKRDTALLPQLAPPGQTKKSRAGRATPELKRDQGSLF